MGGLYGREALAPPYLKTIHFLPPSHRRFGVGRSRGHKRIRAGATISLGYAVLR